MRMKLENICVFNDEEAKALMNKIQLHFGEKNLGKEKEEMISDELFNLVGLNELKAYVRRMVNRPEPYTQGGAKFKDILVNISKGNGQTTITESITEILGDYGIKQYGCREEHLEYRINKGCNNLGRIFETIANSATYLNNYNGVVGIDITALAEYVNEPQMDLFLENMREISKDATIIYYYDEREADIEKLKEALKESMGRSMVEIYVKPYSTKDYAEIIKRDIKGREIDFIENDELEAILKVLIDQENVSCISDAVSLADDLVFCVDYKGKIPKLKNNLIKKQFNIV